MIVFLSRLKRIPVELHVALAATLSLFALNVIWAFSQSSWKIDPGTATLAGAIIGLTIVGAQARRGFANLVKSQRNQAELDREARIHQADLGRAGEATKRILERDVLLAALWAEVVTVYKHVRSAEKNGKIFTLVHQQFHEQKEPVHPNAKIILPKISAPVFMAQIPNLGLLDSSLAADVVAVLSLADGQGLSVDAGSLNHQIMATLYEAHAEAMKEWRQDLYHVAVRIDDIKCGRPGPGSLTMTEVERRKGQ